MDIIFEILNNPIVKLFLIFFLIYVVLTITPIILQLKW